MRKVKHLVVVTDLRVEPIEVVARGLDLPAGQRVVHKAHVYSRCPEDDSQLRPHAVLSRVGVFPPDPSDQRRSDVDISHNSDDSGGRQTEEGC